jgi:probable F420-dependent oxidoreductase
MEMRFSVGGSTGLTWTDYIAAAKAAEELGYYGLYPSDHLMPVADRGGSAERLDPPTALAGVACHTTKLKLGVLVLANSFRHPVITAKVFSTLDHVSNGRAELGIGSGNTRHEYEVHGFPFPPLAERLGRLDEALTVIKLLWTQDEATFQGQYFRLDGAPFDPKPVQKPHPRIIVGGAHPGSLRIAARHADEWNVMGGLGAVKDSVQQMRAICQEEGRDFSTLRISHQIGILVTDSKTEADAFVQRNAATMQHSRTFKLLPQYATVEDQARDFVLAGSGAEIQEQVQRWREVGVTHFYWYTPRPFNPKPLERFAKEVMVAFQ